MHLKLNDKSVSRSQDLNIEEIAEKLLKKHKHKDPYYTWVIQDKDVRKKARIKKIINTSYDFKNQLAAKKHTFF